MTTGFLGGRGAFTANGGDSAFWEGEFTDGGGGGGRVAVYHGNGGTFSGQGISMARPGTGLNPPGEPGTVRFFTEPEFHLLADE